MGPRENQQFAVLAAFVASIILSVLVIYGCSMEVGRAIQAKASEYLAPTEFPSPLNSDSFSLGGVCYVRIPSRTQEFINAGGIVKMAPEQNGDLMVWMPGTMSRVPSNAIEEFIRRIDDCHLDRAEHPEAGENVQRTATFRRPKL